MERGKEKRKRKETRPRRKPKKAPAPHKTFSDSAKGRLFEIRNKHRNDKKNVQFQRFKDVDDDASNQRRRTNEETKQCSIELNRTMCEFLLLLNIDFIVIIIAIIIPFVSRKRKKKTRTRHCYTTFGAECGELKLLLLDLSVDREFIVFY